MPGTNRYAWFVLVLTLCAGASADEHAGGTKPRLTDESPILAACQRVNQDAKYSFQTIGLAKIGQAMAESLRVLDEPDLASAVVKRLKQDKIPVAAVSADALKKASDKIFKQWFGPGRGDLERFEFGNKASGEFKPDWIQACKKSRDDYPSIKDDAKIKDDVASQGKRIQDLILQTEALMTNLTPMELFSALTDACRTASYLSVKAPPECEIARLKEVRNRVVRQYADSQNPAKNDDTTLKQALQSDFRKIKLNSLKADPFADWSKADPVKDKDKLREAFYAMASGYSTWCEGADEAYQTLFDRTLGKMRNDFARSKPTIRYLESQFLSAKHYDAANAIVMESASALSDFFEKEIAPRSQLTDPQKKDVVADLKKLRLSPITPIPENQFRKTAESPLAIWDTNPSTRRLESDNSPFLNSSLSDFTSVNAAFSPLLKEGERLTPEHVELNPILWLVGIDNPSVLRATLFHEAGHKLGPRMAAIMKFNLGETVAKLKACFKKLFNLREEEMDEAFSDWLSAQLIAKRLAAIPDPKARRAELEAELSSYCSFLSLGEMSFDLLGKDVHPHPLIRLERIFGREPIINETLSGPPGPYCTLDGEKGGDAK